jgi:3-oxoacid CoA-transferase subunit B
VWSIGDHRSGHLPVDKTSGSDTTLIELADGVSDEEIKAKTAADFKVALNGSQSNAA